MTDNDIIEMRTIDKTHEGQTVTVVGIISHKEQLEDGSWSAWLQDGVACELRFTDEVYRRCGSALLAAVTLVRGVVSWEEAGPGSWAKLCKIQVESTEPRELLGIKTTTAPGPAFGDLDPASQQPELYTALLDALAGGFRNGRLAASPDRLITQRDIIDWLIDQDWCAPADWLVVAQFWGGDQLRADLETCLSTSTN